MHFVYVVRLNLQVNQILFFTVQIVNTIKVTIKNTLFKIDNALKWNS